MPMDIINQFLQFFSNEKLMFLVIFGLSIVLWEALKYLMRHKLPETFKNINPETGKVEMYWARVAVVVLGFTVILVYLLSKMGII